MDNIQLTNDSLDRILEIVSARMSRVSLPMMDVVEPQCHGAYGSGFLSGIAECLMELEWQVEQEKKHVTNGS